MSDGVRPGGPAEEGPAPTPLDNRAESRELAGLDDPRTLRVEIAAGMRLPGDEPLRIAPAEAGPAQQPGSRPAGSQPPGSQLPSGPSGPRRWRAIVDGTELPLRLERRDAARGMLAEGEDLAAWRTRILFGPSRGSRDGRERREVVVDGWRFEVEIEAERRARLREKVAADALRVGRAGGPLEIRAIIPGRVVSVDVAPGDQVEAGQRLLVIEAMKMQNEIRADRAGTVRRVVVAAGQTVELGDVLVALE